MLKVRAVAAPGKDSTAIGSIELQCSAHGLLMLYLSVGAYSEGYAPAAVTSGTRCLAPWPDVLEVRTHDDAVLLSINPTLTPHHKLYLKNFSQGDSNPVERRRQRWLLRGATLLMMLTVGCSLAGSLLAGSSDPWQLTALGLGLSAALGVLLVGLVAEKLWLPGAPSSELLQRQLLAEIQHYRPAPVLPARTLGGSRPEVLDLLQLLPRSTTAIVIVLSAGSLAAVLTSSWILGTDTRGSREPDLREATADKIEHNAARYDNEAASVEPEPKSADVASPGTALPAASAPASPTNTGAVASNSAPAPLSGACQCERADSVLWRLPLPRLSTLLIEQRLRSHQEHHHVDLELAVVNNGRTSLKEVGLIVQFSEEAGKKPTKDRPLFYESWLAPGEAIKWSVEARGDSFIIHNVLNEQLTADQLATADNFAELLKANHRPVRLHGAMMLAYLGDPRAREGATQLREALREEEMPFLDRVLAASNPAVACQIQGSRDLSGNDQLQLCVYNRGNQAAADLGIKVRALDREFDFRNPTAAPPLVLSEKVFSVPEALPAGEGRWVKVELPAANGSPKALSFEAFADLASRL